MLIDRSLLAKSTMTLAVIGLISLPETFTVDLDFHEVDGEPQVELRQAS